MPSCATGKPTCRLNKHNSCRVSLRSPGTRACEVRGARSEPFAAISSRDVTQHSLLHSRAAFVRRGSSFLSHPSPKRGGGGAPTGALFCYVARARRDDRVSETRAVPLQPGRPLGAPSWRFSAGDPCCRLRQWHRSRPATCPHQVKCLAGEVPDLLRCGSRRNRGTPLPAPSSGSSPEDAPSERGCEIYIINPLRSQALSSDRSRKNAPDTTGRHARA